MWKLVNYSSMDRLACRSARAGDKTWDQQRFCRRLRIESLEPRQLLSGVQLETAQQWSPDLEPFQANVFQLAAKAQPDEWYAGFGQAVYPLGEEPSGAYGKPKVNQDYVWGMTYTEDQIWFATAGNAGRLATMAGLGGMGWEDNIQVAEGSASQYAGVPYLLRDILGDWRPPQIHRYDLQSGTYENITPDDRLIRQTLGLRSAGSTDEVVLIAGPNLTFTGINVFAFDAQTGDYLGSRRISRYGDIRQWVNVDGQLYAAVARAKSPRGEGAILRWVGDLEHPFRFLEVGRMDLEGASLAEHEGRLYVSTWPLWEGTLMGWLGFRSDATAGIWMSPELGDRGLRRSDARRWEKVWSIDEYEPDPVVAKSYGGGALASFDGQLYWGTMQVYGSGATIFHEQYPQAAMTADLYAKTHRPLALFRGDDFDDPEARTVELLYGDSRLFVYTPSSLLGGTWNLEENRAGEPTFGEAGFGNRANMYVWSMEVHDDQLYIGTLDEDSGMYGTLYAALRGSLDWSERLLKVIGLPDVRLGADLWCIPSGDEEAFSVTKEGAGNPLNHGIRTMVSTPHGLFLGTANASNLLTEPYAPPAQPLKAGGWELIQVVPVDGARLGPIGEVELEDLDPSSGDLWFEIETTLDGYLTCEAAADDGGSVHLALYENTHDGDLPAVSVLVSSDDSLRWRSDEGKSYYLCLSGTSGDVDLWLDNTEPAATRDPWEGFPDDETLEEWLREWRDRKPLTSLLRTAIGVWFGSNRGPENFTSPHPAINWMLQYMNRRYETLWLRRYVYIA